MRPKNAIFHRTAVCGLALAAALGGIQVAVASDLPVPYQHVEYKQTGNVFEWKPLTKTGPGTNGVIFRGDTTISNAEPKISTQARLPYDKRPDSDIPAAQKVKVSSPVTKANFGKALVLAGKIAWPIGVFIYGGEIFDYLKDLRLQDIRNTPEGLKANLSMSIDGFEYNAHDTGWKPTLEAACAAGVPASSNAPWVKTFLYAEPESNRCRYKNTHPDGSTTHGWLSTMQRSALENILRELDEQAIADHIAQESGWGNQHAEALQEALNVPGVTLNTETPTVTGPSSIPGPSTTTTESTKVAPGTTTEVPSSTPDADPATKTTTTTSTTNNTYNQNKVTTNTTTNTTTNITNNVTNNTTNNGQKIETTDKPPEQDLCEKYPDSPMCKPQEPEEDLCQKNPDILACSKPELDTPDEEIPKTEKNLTYEEEDNFGGGTCPADVHSNIGGKSYKVYDWAQTCNVVSQYLRPLIILLGAMGALFILIPGRDA